MPEMPTSQVLVMLLGVMMFAELWLMEGERVWVWTAIEGNRALPCLLTVAVTPLPAFGSAAG